ncbi:MAG: hypothetical protein HQK49_07240 [Oligoflexia bacterium]|nr:hypothetical protein [Oligoflexia bacterium]
MAEKAILEQGFDDSELASIMSEIEDLEKEFMDDNSLSSEEGSVASAGENKKLDDEIASLEDASKKQKLKVVPNEDVMEDVITEEAPTDELSNANVVDSVASTSASEEAKITDDEKAAFTEMSSIMEENLEIKDNQKILPEPKVKKEEVKIAEVKADQTPAPPPKPVQNKSNEELSFENALGSELGLNDKEISKENLGELKIVDKVEKTKLQSDIDAEMTVRDDVVEKKVEEKQVVEKKIEDKKVEEKVDVMMDDDPMASFINDVTAEDTLPKEVKKEEVKKEELKKEEVKPNIKPDIKQEMNQMSINNSDNVSEIFAKKTNSDVANAANKSKMKFCVSGEMDVELSFNIGGHDVNLRVEKDEGLIIELSQGMKFVMPFKKCQ